ncbi:MAG: NAD(P)-dependent dehydrogenase (short-subunit alcohol dehydrogenase family) [Bacillariaceae sp.]|jgi:NAD(P)-dependent dehydrogenase (short-subunit alcohol dehydrogenase family)
MAVGGIPIVVVVGATSKFMKQDDDGNVGEKCDNKKDDGGDDDDPPPKWGLGGALAVPFAASGYNIVLMGRRMEILQEVQQSVELVHRDAKLQQEHEPKVMCTLCDVTDSKSVQSAFNRIQDNIGTLFHKDSFIDLIIYNVAPPYPPGFKFEGWGDVLHPHLIDTTNMSFQVDTLVNGLIRVCKNAIPGMIERQRGCVLIAGESCCNLHGGDQSFGSVSPARAAIRSLTQSMFRSYGPMGIHVCNINIGGIIDTPRTRMWKMRPELTSPSEIALQFFNAYKQPSTVWSYEIQLTHGFSTRKVDMRM